MKVTWKVNNSNTFSDDFYEIGNIYIVMMYIINTACNNM